MNCLGVAFAFIILFRAAFIILFRAVRMMKLNSARRLPYSTEHQNRFAPKPVERAQQKKCPFSEKKKKNGVCGEFGWAGFLVVCFL